MNRIFSLPFATQLRGSRQLFQTRNAPLKVCAHFFHKTSLLHQDSPQNHLAGSPTVHIQNGSQRQSCSSHAEGSCAGGQGQEGEEARCAETRCCRARWQGQQEDYGQEVNRASGEFSLSLLLVFSKNVCALSPTSSLGMCGMCGTTENSRKRSVLWGKLAVKAYDAGTDLMVFC